MFSHFPPSYDYNLTNDIKSVTKDALLLFYQIFLKYITSRKRKNKQYFK